MSEATDAVRVLALADIGFDAPRALLARHDLELVEVEDGAPIPGSYWGDSEAGVIGSRVYARRDTPVHSLLHEACHLLVIPPERRALVHTDASDSQIEEDAIQAELTKDCPKCTLSAVNVEVPDWATQVASTTTSQLLQHPDATVLFPDYAGELTYVLAGIQAAHRTDGKTYLAFGGGTPFVQLQTASPGKDIIQSDVSESPPWTGYLLFLQAVRGLEKLPPIPYDQAIGPDRIITPDNAVDVLTTGGFGDDWVNGFRELLGLPDLSGSALHAASTLNGAMTAKA